MVTDLDLSGARKPLDWLDLRCAQKDPAPYCHDFLLFSAEDPLVEAEHDAEADLSDPECF